MRTHDHIAPMLGAELGLLLLGTAVPLQELDLLEPTWAPVLLLTLIVVGVGVATALADVVGARGNSGGTS